jgi:hypothetical protein
MKLFTKFKFLSLLLFIIFLIISTGETNAQPSTANYNFTHATTGSLTDMTGSTEWIGPNATFTTSGIQDIGFTFIFMGTPHTTFGVSARGVLRLGGNPSGSGTNNLNTSSSSFLPLITPYWDNIATSATGKVHSLLTGTAPNRVLIIEWLNMRNNQGSTTSDATFQLRLHESTGVIEFVYGEMNIGAGSATVTSSIGFTIANADNSKLSVSSITSPAVITTGTMINNLVNSNVPGPIAGLNSSNQGERVIYTFTPQAPPSPTNLSITNVTPGSMTLNWTPAAPIVSQAIYISTDNVEFDYLTSVSSLANSYNAEGLNPSTTYYWRIYSVSEGTLSSPLEGSQITNPGSYAGGTKTIGTMGDYTNLQSIFNDINALGLTGAVTIELLADYNPAVETYPINVGFLTGSSETNPVILRPAAGVTNKTFASVEIQTFNLNGTKYFTIDGRPGGVIDGSGNEITISNTNTSGNSVRFINGASNNTLKYCNVNGVNTGFADGVIRVADSGNDNLTFNNCEIRDGATPPANLISIGDFVGSNDSISVTNCRFFNNSGSTIFFTGSSDGYTVSGNSIYRTIAVSGNQNYGIRFQGSGNGHIITNNFIGGSDVNCGGSPSQWGNQFWGIQLSSNSSSSLIQNNTIQNLTTGTSVASGINVGGTGHIVTGNTIGHNSTPNSIVSNGSFSGVQIDGGSSSITVSNNLIANLTSTGTGTIDNARGVIIYGGNNSIIENNIIHTLTSNSTSTAIDGGGGVVGIGSEFQPFNGIIRGNTLYNLVNIPGGAGTANTSTLGIAILSTVGVNIISNRIYNLRNQSSGSSPNIFGISGISGKGAISNNQVSLETGAFNTNPVNVRGIQVNVANVENVWDIFYNSVYIGGETFSGSLVTSAFYKQNTNTVNLRNNLFFNERTGGTGGNYAVAFENNTNVTSDYNLLVSDPTTVGLWGATPYTFADYKTNSGLDGFSYSTDPTTVTTANLFFNAANGDLGINASNDAAYYVDGKGIPIEGVSGDYSDTSGVRNTLISQGTTDIGSDEFEYTGTIPDLTASGPPALNTTTTYSFAGRQIGSIAWGSTGTVPTGITAKYFSGVNPPGILVGEYSKGYWDFTPTGGAGFTYDITLNYTPAILHNIANENNLKMAKFNSEPWEYFPDAAVNTTGKTVTKTGLTTFSAFTLTSSDDPLPVELASFTASIDRRDVYLSWSTTSELNNSGFDVERTLVRSENTPVEWAKIGSVEGNGTTSETKNYTFTERGLNTGKYNYRLKQIDYNGNFEYFNLTNEVIIGVPDKYDLSQNYPNPFNPVTKINFDLPFDSKVTMKIFDITGREIATLVNNLHEAGYYTVTFDAKNIASGMYFYRIIAEGGSQQYVMTKKMAVIK